MIRKRLLTFVICLMIGLMPCGSVHAARKVFDQNQNLATAFKNFLLGLEKQAWKFSALIMEHRLDAIGHMGPFDRVDPEDVPKKIPNEINKDCPEDVGPDTQIKYDTDDIPSLTAALNMIEVCHRNRKDENYESFTMPTVLKTLKPFQEKKFKTAGKYGWVFWDPEKFSGTSPVQYDKEALELNFSKMANIEKFREHVQRVLSVVPREIGLQQFAESLEERQMSGRSLKTDATEFYFSNSLVNHSLTAENEWRYDRGIQVSDQALNLREEMQGLNFVTLGLLSESERNLGVMGASLAKLAMDSLFREEDVLYRKHLAGQGKK